MALSLADFRDLAPENQSILGELSTPDYYEVLETLTDMVERGGYTPDEAVTYYFSPEF